MSDFKAQLQRQLKFLKNSCRAYDDGQVEEAVRLAVTLRVLLHDTKSSISLLTHLQAKSILLLSTAQLFKKPQLLNIGLVAPTINLPDMTFTAQPLLDKAERNDLVVLQSWWRKERVIELNGGADVMHRRDLILAAANKDGGAHVDKTLDPIYDKARLGAGMELEFVMKGGLPKRTASFDNVHYASLRQIAYEVLNSPAIQNLAP